MRISDWSSDVCSSDLAVHGILVNIFGGIMRCDIIAEGIVEAAREVHLSVPLVVRLEGTNVEEGKAILAERGLPIVPANDLGDSARKIVEQVKELEAAEHRHPSEDWEPLSLSMDASLRGNEVK